MPDAKKILVADDEKPLSNALRIKLTKSGYEVVLSENGQDALDKLDSDPEIDLLLLNLVMPIKDGFTVLQELKDNNKSLPVIVSSNLSQVEDKERAKSLGAKEYFVKSEVPINSIIDGIKNYI